MTNQNTVKDNRPITACSGIAYPMPENTVKEKKIMNKKIIEINQEILHKLGYDADTDIYCVCGHWGKIGYHYPHILGHLNETK